MSKISRALLAESPGPVTRKICAKQEAGTCCDYTEEIQVLFCQDATTKKEYFVYRLKHPTNCALSYCAGVGDTPEKPHNCNANCAWNDLISNCSCKTNV